MKDESRMQTLRLSRRQALKLAGAAAGGLVLPTARATAKPAEAKPGGFRFVHLADIHIGPELRAPEGFRQCLDVVHALKPRPDFILTGGDLVADALAASETRARQLFDLYVRMVKDSDIPFRQCIGNHEVFGWSSKGKVSPDHALYGKRMAMDALELERTTYSFEHKGWHFGVVDTVLPNEGEGYIGGVSEEDMDWLNRDLSEAGNKPKILCGHIPFVSVAVFRNVKEAAGPNIHVGKWLMCKDPASMLKLCREKKVTLVLGGHLHQSETLEYDRTTYINEGAVSGAWWKGPRWGHPEGFGLIDVHEDGSFTHEYRTYGWKAVQQ